MVHAVGLAVQAGGADDLAVHLGKQLHMVMGLRLHAEVGLFLLKAKRHALRAEAEVIRFPADGFQIVQQFGGVLRLCADDLKGRLFHSSSFLCILICSGLKPPRFIARSPVSLPKEADRSCAGNSP